MGIFPFLPLPPVPLIFPYSNSPAFSFLNNSYLQPLS